MLTYSFTLYSNIKSYHYHNWYNFICDILYPYKSSHPPPMVNFSTTSLPLIYHEINFIKLENSKSHKRDPMLRKSPGKKNNQCSNLSLFLEGFEFYPCFTKRKMRGDQKLADFWMVRLSEKWRFSSWIKFMEKENAIYF